MNIFDIDIALYLDRIIGVSGILLTVIVGWYFSRPYLPQKKGVAYERYIVTDIYEFPVKNNVLDISHLQLQKSSIKNSCGFAGIHVDEEKIIFRHYGFTNNCLHAIIAPDDILYDPCSTSKKSKSNGFSSINIKHSPKLIPLDLVPKKYKKLTTKALMLTLEYDFPQSYVGPRYQTKNFIFIKGIGLVYAVIQYKGGKKDIFELKKYRVQERSDSWWPVHTIGNYFEYKIVYEYGPNLINIKSS